MNADLENAVWLRSSVGGGAGPAIEVAKLENGCKAVRDSRNPLGGVLIFTPGEWAAFLSGVEGGEFDLPEL
nr:DUF397 domain-containing protein [Nocardia jejuensis]